MRKLARYPDERIKDFLRDNGVDISRTVAFTITWDADSVVYIEAKLIATEPEEVEA